MSTPAPTTIFEHMSRLARQYGAINLGQGFPELPEPPELLAAAARAVCERKIGTYPQNSRGVPARLVEQPA